MPSSPRSPAGDAQPMTPEELRDAGVRIAGLVLVDNAGLARLKCVPIDRLARAAERGIGWSSIWGLSLGDDSFAHDPGLYSPSGDLRLRADLDAAALVGGAPGWAFAPIDHYEQSGEPWPGCQRGFVRRVLGQAEDAGVEVVAAWELEWSVGREEDGHFVPLHRGPGYGAATFGDTGPFMLDLVDALAESGIVPEQVHPEYANGQMELSLPPTDLLRACDESILARQVIRTVAASHGWRASFSPRVVAGSVGNGAHIHISIWRDGVNLLAGGEGPEGLHPDGAAFIAGALGAATRADCDRRAERSFVRSSPARALGRRIRLLGQREPRGGAPARGRERRLYRVGQRRVEVGRRGCQSVPRRGRRSSRLGWTGVAQRLELPAAGPGWIRTRCPTRIALPAPSSGFPRRLPKQRRSSPLPTCCVRRWGRTCTIASPPCAGPKPRRAAISTRRRSFPPTAGGTDEADLDLSHAPVVDAHCHPWRNRELLAEDPARLRGPDHDDGHVPDLVRPPGRACGARTCGCSPTHAVRADHAPPARRAPRLRAVEARRWRRPRREAFAADPVAYNRRLWEAANVGGLVYDEGYPQPTIAREDFAADSGATVHRVGRIEPLIATIREDVGALRQSSRAVRGGARPGRGRSGARGVQERDRLPDRPRRRGGSAGRLLRARLRELARGRLHRDEAERKADPRPPAARRARASPSATTAPCTSTAAAATRRSCSRTRIHRISSRSSSQHADQPVVLIHSGWPWLEEGAYVASILPAGLPRDVDHDALGELRRRPEARGAPRSRAACEGPLRLGRSRPSRRSSGSRPSSAARRSAACSVPPSNGAGSTRRGALDRRGRPRGNVRRLHGIGS